jgi:UDP-N-acetylmuramoyl-L-alanyl-D-glutamate--2,6-diaminopimelate ligase
MDKLLGMTLSYLLDGWVRIPAGLDCELADIHQDSREVTEGSLFIALHGLKHDGARFIDDAIRAGARAVITEGDKAEVCAYQDAVLVRLPGLYGIAGDIASRFFGDVSADMLVIGVTGTNGKSSVTHFIAQLASAQGLKSAVIGTLGYGLLGALKDTGHTTPATVAMHRMLWMLQRDGCELVAVEVSSHALDQQRVNGVKFAVAVLTNVTQDHLDYHGTMAEYSLAKRRLFDWKGLQRVVINQDDEYGRRWGGELVNIPVTTYSNYGPADLSASSHVHSEEGVTFDLACSAGKWRVGLPLLGDFNVSNYLAAFAALLAVGQTHDSIVAVTPLLKSVAGRLEIVTLASGPKVIIDYAHTPDALAQTLTALRKHCSGRLWCLFGCGGDRDPGKRALMGAIASRLADQVVVTDDNPRSEDPDTIAQAIVAGCIAGAHIEVVRPREKAILQVLQHAVRQDWVLIAGKGHETYQEIQGVKYSFSDHSMVKACWHAVLDRKALSRTVEAGAQ